MDTTAINEILELNKRFYESYAKEFSLTRVAPWPGWDRILPYLQREKPLKIADVGCGNGRFYKYLKTTLKTDFSYVGLDASESLINEATLSNEQTGNNTTLFLVKDFLNPSTLEDILLNINVICGFGIMHHIPTLKRRVEFVQTLWRLLPKKGELIMTFWSKEPEQDKVVKNLGENDYFIKWGKGVDAYRYVHIFNESEVHEISNQITQDNGKIVETYLADGKDTNSNMYMIWEKL